MLSQMGGRESDDWRQVRDRAAGANGAAAFGYQASLRGGHNRAAPMIALARVSSPGWREGDSMSNSKQLRLRIGFTSVRPRL